MNVKNFHLKGARKNLKKKLLLHFCLRGHWESFCIRLIRILPYNIAIYKITLWGILSLANIRNWQMDIIGFNSILKWQKYFHMYQVYFDTKTKACHINYSRNNWSSRIFILREEISRVLKTTK